MVLENMKQVKHFLFSELEYKWNTGWIRHMKYEYIYFIDENDTVVAMSKWGKGEYLYYIKEDS